MKDMNNKMVKWEAGDTYQNENGGFTSGIHVTKCGEKHGNAIESFADDEQEAAFRRDLILKAMQFSINSFNDAHPGKPLANFEVTL